MTRSGSSTPASCTFVVDSPGTPLSAEAGGGPVAATGPAPPSAPCEPGTGMRASGTGGGRPTRVGTPMLPRVRRSALRA